MVQQNSQAASPCCHRHFLVSCQDHEIKKKFVNLPIEEKKGCFCPLCLLLQNMSEKVIKAAVWMGTITTATTLCCEDLSPKSIQYLSQEGLCGCAGSNALWTQQGKLNGRHIEVTRHTEFLASSIGSQSDISQLNTFQMQGRQFSIRQMARMCQ